MRHDNPHYALLAAALTGSAPAPAPGWDWDHTVDLASRQEVLSSLYRHLYAPPDVTDFLEAIHELNAQRNALLLAELEAHAVLLNQAGIQPVLLKGAAYLVTGAYRDPAVRLLQDMDLLVNPAQSQQAYEIIRQTGYEPFVPNPTALVLHHHPALVRPHRVPVEIHHSVAVGSSGTFLTPEEILKASIPMQLGAATVRIPSPEHLMTHLILHSQMQHGLYDRIWPSLRAMFDLVQLGRRFTIPWDAIVARFRRHGKEALLNLHLLQVEKALGIAPPFAIRGRGLRWHYRQALWAYPHLRYIDPVFSFSRMVLPKLRLSLRLLRHPVGRKYVLSTPFRLSFYKQLLSDISHG